MIGKNEGRPDFYARKSPPAVTDEANIAAPLDVIVDTTTSPESRT